MFGSKDTGNDPVEGSHEWYIKKSQDNASHGKVGSLLPTQNALYAIYLLLEERLPADPS